MDWTPPGSTVHGIVQARILEWASISSSMESTQPRDWTCISCVSSIDRWILYHWSPWEAKLGLPSVSQMVPQSFIISNTEGSVNDRDWAFNKLLCGDLQRNALFVVKSLLRIKGLFFNIIFCSHINMYEFTVSAFLLLLFLRQKVSD